MSSKHYKLLKVHKICTEIFSNVANSSVIHLFQNVKYIAIIVEVNIVVHSIHGCCLKWSLILLDSLSKTINVNIVYFKDINFFPTIFRWTILQWFFRNLAINFFKNCEIANLSTRKIKHL